MQVRDGLTGTGKSDRNRTGQTRDRTGPEPGGRSRDHFTLADMDHDHLKTMNMIFFEVMRLYPLVTELRRTVMKDNTKLGKFTLLIGSLINLPIMYIHQENEIWGDDAKEFNPYRFAQGISKASKGGVSILSFGWGPRIYIGSNFAMLEAKIALSMILQRFEFQLSSSYVHAPISTGLINPQFGAPLVFHSL